MKKLLITAMALSCFALSYGQKKVENRLSENGAILIHTSLRVS